MSTTDFTMATETSHASFMQARERFDNLKLDDIIMEEDEAAQ